ncbi:PE-PPE domain-containing protein [Mycolicibacterium vaccae]|uniref:PE-PPE domain-containing protein n=1 Tax=Mycolicibacterium vaccae TaxID=1810 RepID=UPI003D04D461
MGTVAIGVAPGIADATTTALLVGGKGDYAELSDADMARAMGGYFAEYDKRVSVPFPGSDDFAYSIEVGEQNLYEMVYSTEGFKTIGGVSEGAPSVIKVLRRLVEDAKPGSGKTPPPPSELNVAIYGAPSRALYGTVPYPELVASPYNVILVSAEYDGIADFPDNPFNLLAVVNAAMGAQQLHVDRAFYDILREPTKYNITPGLDGATVTRILIPTELLPLLVPMSEAGVNPEFVKFLDRVMRPMIDSAYRRPKWTVGIPPTVTPITGPVSEPRSAERVSTPVPDPVPLANPVAPEEIPLSARQSLVSGGVGTAELKIEKLGDGATSGQRSKLQKDDLDLGDDKAQIEKDLDLSGGAGDDGATGSGGAEVNGSTGGDTDATSGVDRPDGDDQGADSPASNESGESASSPAA